MENEFWKGKTSCLQQCWNPNENISLQSKPPPTHSCDSDYSVSYATLNDTNVTKPHISVYLTKFNLKKKIVIISKNKVRPTEIKQPA